MGTYLWNVSAMLKKNRRKYSKPIDIAIAGLTIFYSNFGASRNNATSACPHLKGVNILNYLIRFLPLLELRRGTEGVVADVSIESFHL